MLLREDIKGHDYVFHLAANPEDRKGIEKTNLDLNIGTIAIYNVLETMRLNKKKNHICI